MRILIINHFPLEGSGSGVYTKNLAETLSSFGHEIMVIYPEHAPKNYPGFQSKSIIFEGGNPMGPVDLPFNFPCFTSHPRSHFTFYDMTENQIKSYVQAFNEAVKEGIRQHRPDVIHAQHIWITPYVASLYKIPYVVTAHGTDLKGYALDERYHIYAHQGADKASGVITISKQVDQEVEDIFKVPQIKRHLILNGYNSDLFKTIDVKKEAILAAHKIPYHGEKIVFFAGKMANFKGVDLLIKAAKIYEEDKIITVIAGDGDQYETLNELKDTLGLNKVYFIGHQSQETLVTWYNIAQVSCVPSRKEPFGLVAIEALACGAPVVGTRQGGLIDFIHEGVGVLVEPENPEDLARGIQEILKRNQNDEMRETCSTYAKQNFSREISIADLEKIYKQVIKNHKK